MNDAWRNHPKLKGRFHADHPDDLQVVVHDGGPRFTRNTPELIWVCVSGILDVGGYHGDVFTGTMLNQPHALTSSKRGDSILFIAPEQGDLLLQVREKYLKEREAWKILPCEGCKLTELFDAPSDLIRKVFPNAPEGATLSSFSAFCGACRGVQIVASKDFAKETDEEPLSSERAKIADKPPFAAPPSKKWWEFWK